MKEKGERLYRHIKWLEFGIAGILVLALVVIAGRMIVDLWQIAPSIDSVELIDLILADAFLLVIGVEFVKMIIRPTSENVLEVIMLTITRALIMDHSSMVQTLIGVLSMLVLFIIRKYFFCEMRASEVAPKPPAKHSVSNQKISLPSPGVPFSKALDDVSHSEDRSSI